MGTLRFVWPGIQGCSGDRATDQLWATGSGQAQKDTLLNDVLFPSTLLPLGPLTLIIHFTHHGLQAMLFSRLINGASIQSNGISLQGLLGTCVSAPPSPLAHSERSSGTPTSPPRAR